MFQLLVAIYSLTILSSYQILEDPRIEYLNTPVGIERLTKSQYKQKYWQLSIYFDTQKEPTFCAVATVTMILNALDVNKPAWRSTSIYKMHMQDLFFTPEVEKIVTKERALKKGVDLPEMAMALKTFGVNVHMWKGKYIKTEEFRQLLKETLNNENHYIAINYFRPTVSQAGTGHFSPIAAYDEESDTALVMDVARFKYPPAWIPLSSLVESMKALDVDTGDSRGLLIISK